MATPADEDTPTGSRDDALGDVSANKKRRVAPNARGVANLTPEQLARKRANDREAQRAIRERTKNQIDRLNQRIRDLESQQPYHDLQLVIREKEAVQAENADIKKRLESVLGIIQPILRTSGGLNELAAAAERSPLPVLPHHPIRDAPADVRQFHATLHEIAAASPSNGIQSPSAAENGRSWLYPADGQTSHMRRHSNESPGPHFDHPRPAHAQGETSFDERMGVDFLLDNGQRRAVDPNLPPPAQLPPSNVSCSQKAQYAPIDMVPHLTLPRNIEATCPLDVILLDFLQDRQQRAAEGVPTRTLVGPSYPNFTPFVYPERNNIEAHPLSKLFTDVLRTFPDICGLPEQVAIVYLMFLVMRWQIEPTQENYDRLPHWFTPRPSQLFAAHPLWFDHVPWPKLRDKLVAQRPFVNFEHFFVPFTTTVSLNWPYEPRDCLLPASQIHASAHSSGSSIHTSSPFTAHANAGSPQGPATPSVGTPSGVRTAMGPLPSEDDIWLINPAFESHLRDLNNWTLGHSFRATLPQFGDCIKIKGGR